MSLAIAGRAATDQPNTGPVGDSTAHCPMAATAPPPVERGLPPGGICLHLIDGQKQPVANQAFLVLDAQGNMVASGASDGSGLCVYDSMPAGEFTVCAVKTQGDMSPFQPGAVVACKAGNQLYDRAVYEARKKWQWGGYYDDDTVAPAPPVVVNKKPELIANLEEDSLVRVEQVLYDATKVKGLPGRLQVVEVTAFLSTGPTVGFLFTYFKGKPFLKAVGATIRVEENKPQTYDLIVDISFPLGPVLRSGSPQPVTPVTPVAPAPVEPGEEPTEDEGKKYELLKALVLQMRKWDKIPKKKADYDYASGKGSEDPVFHEEPWEPNIVSLRAWTDAKGITDPADKNYAGTYCSTFYVLYKDGEGNRRCEHFRSAVNCAPPTANTAAAIAYSGTETVLPGQYTFHQYAHHDFYTSEKLRFPALDHAPHGLWYHEAAHKDGGPGNIFMSGGGTHIHSGRPQDSCRHTTIGCQILWGVWTNWRYQRFLFLMSRGPDGKFLADVQRPKHYTLIDARTLDAGLLEQLKALGPRSPEIEARYNAQTEKIGLKDFYADNTNCRWAPMAAFPAGVVKPGK